jgi:hypothetical protein
MRQVRVSIAGLMALVAVAAVGFAAVRTGSTFGFRVAYSLVVTLLIVATIAARYRRGREGAFWFGAAVTGWALFLVGHSYSPNVSFLPNPNLLTTMLGRKLTDLVIPRRAVIASSGDLISLIGFDVHSERDRATLGTVLMMMVVALALVGGLVSVAIAGQQGRQERNLAEQVDGTDPQGGDV